MWGSIGKEKFGGERRTWNVFRGKKKRAWREIGIGDREGSGGGEKGSWTGVGAVEPSLRSHWAVPRSLREGQGLGALGLPI